MSLDENLQCECDSFEAQALGGSTQGPASGILAAETETERRGDARSSQCLRVFESLPQSHSFTRQLLPTFNTSMASWY